MKCLISCRRWSIRIRAGGLSPGRNIGKGNRGWRPNRSMGWGEEASMSNRVVISLTPHSSTFRSRAKSPCGCVHDGCFKVLGTHYVCPVAQGRYSTSSKYSVTAEADPPCGHPGRYTVPRDIVPLFIVRPAVAISQPVSLILFT